ncbi:MAG: Stk1 family PASTA domain-containing Ser/Thr kinase [Eggerthellaceae bacterium]|jgi:serine/threonine-protein kinase|nr:Stk1 family PASTA domain-containing Ser/Thr kinase [Eggerthellaceae bacterium]MDR2716312.1 Stk1 family PASTA domain-containing Ser/Thr kinase [Coriobacteriaceae bacterium]
MIGKVFNNRYKLTDRIGIGGMAEVYHAYDEVLGRVVAVKIMLPQYAADSNFTQRFKQEAAAAANLQSPYVVNVYDWGQDEGVYYIVMEYVRGSDLKTAINERGSINQRKVAEIGAQVCQALTSAHNLDIIHRDIKPQNIMVQPDGNVKVMDFGIARAKNSLMTQTPSVLGTAHYISPEQAQGKELTPASDIYSLGIVLYEAATGALPFDGPDAVSVAMQQVNDFPPPPHEYNPSIDPDFEDIIMMALAKNPVDRFATANDMRIALSDFLAGRPVHLDSDFSRAETSVLGGMAGIGAAKAGGMAGSLPDGTAVMPPMVPAPQNMSGSGYRSRDMGRQDRPEGVNKKTVGTVLAIIAALLAIGGAVFFFVNQEPKTGEPVPNVGGLTIEEATLKLVNAGFEVGTVEEDFDIDVEAGRVAAQDPKAGDRVESGTKVNLVISKGPKQVVVPDLTDKTADEAKEILEELGLKYTAGTAEHSEKIPVNQIIRQEPEAGQTVDEGTTVTYYLSLGIGNTDVPYVIGLSQDGAIGKLEDEGFRVGEVTYQYDDNVVEGLVISQNPRAGMRAEMGSTVDIVVSQGVDPEKRRTSVPDVSGKTENEARAAIATAELAIQIESVYDTNVAKGKVISQYPGPGERLDKGSTVNVVVSNGPEPASPPPSD